MAVDMARKTRGPLKAGLLCGADLPDLLGSLNEANAIIIFGLGHQLPHRPQGVHSRRDALSLAGWWRNHVFAPDHLEGADRTLVPAEAHLLAFIDGHLLFRFLTIQRSLYVTPHGFQFLCVTSPLILEGLVCSIYD